jgi:hypothetical protein
MTSSGIGNIRDSGDPNRDIRAQLESQFQGPVDVTVLSSSNHNNGKARQIGKNLAETQPTEGMSLINQLNSILEELNISKTGQFQADATGNFKFKVNQAYLEEKGFLIVQNDLLKLNQEIQENPSLHEHILNYKVEIDPTRNVLIFKPSAEFTYAPEIVNIRNIRRESSGKNIFEDYSENTLIPVLVGPPPLDYLRKTNGEKSNKFNGIEDNAFKALEKAAKKEDQYKINFHVAHALNIAMLPNGKWSIIDDSDLLNRMRFPTTEFKRLLSPEIAINAQDIQTLKQKENLTQLSLDTPFTPPATKEILRLPTNVQPYMQGPPHGQRLTLVDDPVPLAPESLKDHLNTAGLGHFVQYFLRYNVREKNGEIQPGMPQKDHGMLTRPNPEQDYLIPPIPPKQ